MGYLTIKKLNKDKINIHSTKQYISLSYKLDYINLSSISLTLKKITITENNGYYIKIGDPESIELLKILDNHLSENIDNYKNMIHLDNDGYYIYLKQNNYLDTYIEQLKEDKITINIIKLKKNASHTFPIVYVL